MREARAYDEPLVGGLFHDLGANGRVRRPPHPQVQLDFAPFLIGTRSVEPEDFDHAAARPLSREVRAAEVGAEVVHERIVGESNQHGPQNPQPYSSASALSRDRSRTRGKTCASPGITR